MRVGVTILTCTHLNLSDIIPLYLQQRSLLAGDSHLERSGAYTRVSWHKVIIHFLPADLLALPICGAVRAVCCERGESATKRISASRVMEVVSSTYLWFCLLVGFLATVSTSRWDRRNRTSG